MKLRLKKLSVFVIISILIVGCETCDDCGPVNNYPYFNLSIFNSTSLDTLRIDSSNYIVALANIDTMVMELETAIEEDPNMEDFYQVKIDSLLKLDTLNNQLLSSINSKIRDTRGRLISIESINDVGDLFLPEEGESDSASSFRIPINAGASESEYNIKIGNSDIKRFFRVSYTLEDTVINNRITKSAKNLQIIGNSDFDSISGPSGCSPVINCSSNQLNIYVEI